MYQGIIEVLISPLYAIYTKILWLVLYLLEKKGSDHQFDLKGESYPLGLLIQLRIYQL